MAFCVMIVEINTTKGKVGNMRKRKSLNCVHNLDKENSTIKILENFRTMVVPDIRYGVCLRCGQKFEFDTNNKILREGGALKDANVGGNEEQT